METIHQTRSKRDADSSCILTLAHADEHVRRRLLDALWLERQQRKSRDIVAIFDRTGGDWNQTMHTMLLKFIGGFDNGEAAMRLAERVPYAIIMRERSSKGAIEALLLGASGLLSLYDSRDEYVAHLIQEYTHLAIKYNIDAMDADEWRTVRVRMQNHPTLRLAQLAACYMENVITMSSVTSCERVTDIYNLFSGKVSSYWLNHFIPNTIVDEKMARFGKTKCELLGINFVAQMIYAYGNYTHSEALRSQAWRLLASIPAERNIYTESWNTFATIAHNAIDSQALIQLSREYCHAHRCHLCPLSKLEKESSMIKDE
ncbi:MAG: DUF2851 family protein [Alistipes sp.]|nr:DUF2851 family protein [Alistipes sp.]